MNERQLTALLLANEPDIPPLKAAETVRLLSRPATRRGVVARTKSIPAWSGLALAVAGSICAAAASSLAALDRGTSNATKQLVTTDGFESQKALAESRQQSERLELEIAALLATVRADIEIRPSTRKLLSNSYQAEIRASEALYLMDELLDKKSDGLPEMLAQLYPHTPAALRCQARPDH